MSTEVTATPTQIGGEMFSWSDRDPARGPAVARSAALAHLLAELGGPDRAVLLAGPHDDALVSRVQATGAVVSCLLRSLTDAQRLARLFPDIAVLCGSISKLDTAARFDVVIAGDGLDRLGSTEGEQSSTAEMLEILAGVLQPGGTLALMYDNPLGIHHTVQLPSGQPFGSDANWYPLHDTDDERPGSLAHLHAELTAHGVTPGIGYAVYPAPGTPTVFIGPEPLGDTGSPLRPHLTAALSRAFVDAYADMPVLCDPRRIAGPALQAGAEGILAPAWLVLAHRGTPAAPPPRHAIVIGEPADPYTIELSSRDGCPQAVVLVPPDVAERAGLRRVTEPAAHVAAGGISLEERLLHLCARSDVLGLRAELGRFVGWIEAHSADGLTSGPTALATAGTVLADGPELHLIAPRWEPVTPVSVRTVVARACWAFAVRLVTGHRPHPWSLTSSAAELAGTLLSMLDRGLNEDELGAVVDLQVACDTADRGLAPAARQARRLELLALRPGAGAVDIRGYHELAEALWQQRYQSSHLLAMVEWTDQMIRSRDIAHSRMDWEIQLFRQTRLGRVILLARSAYRLLRRDTRSVVRKARRAVGRRPEVGPPVA